MRLRSILIAASFCLAAWGAAAGGAVASDGISAAPCGRQNWDPDAYEEVNDPCLVALGFDPRLYFENIWHPDDLRPAGVADAVFYDPFQGVIWAFAIKHACPADQQCAREERRILLRAVSMKLTSELSKGWKYVDPRSKEDVERLLDQVTKWREADIQTCPGAPEKLLSLEKVSWMRFDGYDRGRIKGRDDPDEFIVMADGYSVEVRASSGFKTVHSRDKGFEGSPGGWAMEMMELVEPCLKLTSAPPPWER